MRYTCGIIFYRDGQILIGHATGQSHWDLPKGKAEGNETYSEAAVRECEEETGFLINESDLLLLGEVPYRKGKRLVLFFYTGQQKPNTNELFCLSTYTNRHGNIRPEFDEFQYVDVSDCAEFLTTRMCKSIINAVTMFITNKRKG